MRLDLQKMQKSHFMSSHQERFLARDGRATLLAGIWGGLICSTQHPLLYDHRIFKIFKIFKIFNSTFHPNTLHLMRRANPVLNNYLAGLKSECQGLLRSAGNVVINFGLQWSLQTTAKLKSSIESDLSVHTGRRKHRHPENTQCWCKCLGPLSQENEEYKISTKSLNHQHVTLSS